MMKSNKNTPLEPIRCLLRNFDLVVSLVKRDVIGRYQGSFLGLFWSFVNPLFMLAVYTFVFTVIFKSRWAGGTDSKIEFALLLFAGLIVFTIFSESVGRAANLIVANANYVKKVVFPLEILPWVNVGAAVFHAAVSFAVWLIVYSVFNGLPKLNVVLLPVILLPLIFIILGFSWFLASLGVFLRDVGQLVNIFITMLMFLSPIFYPASSLPQNYHKLFMLNPLAPTIEQVRNVMYWGTGIDWLSYGVSLIIAVLFSWIGYLWFQKTRTGFADVL